MWGSWEGPHSPTGSPQDPNRFCLPRAEPELSTAVYSGDGNSHGSPGRPPEGPTFVARGSLSGCKSKSAGSVEISQDRVTSDEHGATLGRARATLIPPYRSG